MRISYTNDNAIFCMRIIIWVEFHHETIDQVHTVIQRSCLDAQILVPEYE